MPSACGESRPGLSPKLPHPRPSPIRQWHPSAPGRGEASSSPLRPPPRSGDPGFPPGSGTGQHSVLRPATPCGLGFRTAVATPKRGTASTTPREAVCSPAWNPVNSAVVPFCGGGRRGQFTEYPFSSHYGYMYPLSPSISRTISLKDHPATATQGSQTGAARSQLEADLTPHPMP